VFRVDIDLCFFITVSKDKRHSLAQDIEVSRRLGLDFQRAPIPK